MKHLLVTAALLATAALAAPAAQAQLSGPDFPKPENGPAASPRPASRGNAAATAREQRRAAMSPEEARRDQQMEILESRTGNTSFSRGRGPERQFDNGGKGKGFMVRKFKPRAGFGEQKRGQMSLAGGVDPKGKPLEHKHKTKKRFLIF